MTDLIRMLDQYWNIPAPVRLDKVTEETSNRDALVFGLKISIVATAMLFLFLFMGLLL